MWIGVETVIGEKITFEVELDDKIKLLKQKIKEEEGIELDKQILIYNTQRMIDDYTFSDYNIGIKSLINLAVKTRYGMQVFVSTLTGRTIVVEVDPNNIIGELKGKIENKIKLAKKEQSLVFGGVHLQDHLILRNDCNIKNESTITLMLRLKAGFQIIISGLTSKMTFLEVDVLDTIDTVKSKFRDAWGVPIDQQILIYVGRQFEGGYTLIECRIQEGATLYVRIKGGGTSINVITPTGEELLLSVELNDTISRFKQEIQDEIGVPINEQILIIDGKQLEDGFTLSDYNISFDPMSTLLLKKKDQNVDRACIIL